MFDLSTRLQLGGTLTLLEDLIKIILILEEHFTVEVKVSGEKMSLLLFES
jgi:hypothetical protein